MVDAKTASVSTQMAAIDATVTRVIRSQRIQMFALVGMASVGLVRLKVVI